MQTEAKTLLRIEKFIIATGELPFDQRMNPERLKQVIRECCQIIPAFKQIYRNDLHYAHFITEFKRYVVDYIDRLRQFKGYSLDDLENCEEGYGIILALYHVYNSFSFSEKNAYRRQEKRNAYSLGHYVKSLIEHYSRLLFVRVDLKYEKNHPKEVTISDVYAHLAILCNRLSNADGCFKHLQGHAWALEQGEQEGGYHIHLLLIYDYSKIDNDKHQGKLVGEEWINITDGCGAYFNLHDPKYREKYIKSGTDGLGLVSRDDPQKVKNAINVALYLTRPSKYLQRLRVKASLSANTFNKGLYVRSYRRGLNFDVEFNLDDYNWKGR
ncbi:inovirus Gp2 family protein [Acinetobacter baumannii]|uniref:YagK/YfjJ domain-containing protein n=1 Tax=Acinetobacter TaxID=469 RepID=UPI0010A8B37E|nr:inovirus-type Gp2 protein [Acinetobacter baumannii]MDC4422604.1 inovirus Gp2 family protein [Acinetobacter baumannii]MDC4522988.1 inovirus Gp2 family protein [Acinetobacter baumannii]MDC4666665.1 inovirus Gp2 family protein [Acinetobacter baumannii]MDC4704478.1 inovirus Gp2 family protein [Acinetobacter baumannii]MDC4727521.1 inovirus Gp2 family protein [Acinetobacter baumannii]